MNKHESTERPDVVEVRGFLSQQEADELLAHIHAAEFKQNYINLYGRKAVPRLEAWFGSWDYPYSRGVILTAAPIPEGLAPIFERLAAQSFGTFNAVLINRYRSGKDYISPHSDGDYGDPNPTIPSLTLGASRPFRLAKIISGNKLDKTTMAEYLPGMAI